MKQGFLLQTGNSTAEGFITLSEGQMWRHLQYVVPVKSNDALLWLSQTYISLWSTYQWQQPRFQISGGSCAFRTVRLRLGLLYD